KTCNNDKSLSEIQLEHEKEDEFVMVVGLYDGGEGDYIDDEEEEDVEGEGGSEVREFDDLNNGKDGITWQSMVWMEEDAKCCLANKEKDSLWL
ncbi:hypothetical protein Tco_1042718, partial [Tanacetum coccineum]